MKKVIVLALSLCSIAQAQRNIITEVETSINIELNDSTIKCGQSNMAFMPTVYVSVPDLNRYTKLSHHNILGRPVLVATKKRCTMFMDFETLFGPAGKEKVKLEIYRTEDFKLSEGKCIDVTSENVVTTIRGTVFYNFERNSRYTDLINCR